MKAMKLAFALATASCATLSHASPPTGIAQSSWADRKKFVRLPNGVRLAYVELGNPGGKPLLLLHGYTDSSRSWSLVAPHLAGYRLIIPDQRGHGTSDAPDCCYSPTQLAYDAILLLDALQVSKAAVAGHSMGSMVAMTMAAEYPNRVTAIALLGSTGLAPVKRGDWMWTNTQSIAFPIDRNSGFMREWHPANQPTHVDPEFASAAMDEIVAIRPQVWRGVIRDLVDVPAARHAEEVKAPVLILSGGSDPIFAAEHHAALLKAFPNAQSHVYAGLGHNFLWEAPADVGARLSGFFAAQ